MKALIFTILITSISAGEQSPLSPTGLSYQDTGSYEDAYKQAPMNDPDWENFQNAYREKYGTYQIERGSDPMAAMADFNKFHDLWTTYTTLRAFATGKKAIFPSPHDYLSDPDAYNRILAKDVKMYHLPQALLKENTLAGCGPIINGQIDCGKRGIFQKIEFTRNQVGESDPAGGRMIEIGRDEGAKSLIPGADPAFEKTKAN